MNLPSFTQLLAAGRRLGLLGLVALGGAGCASTYTFKVDAIRAPSSPPATAVTYTLVSGDPALKASDLQFQEAAGYVRTALAQQGFQAAPAGTTPTLRIELSYGLSEPSVDFRQVSNPVYAETGFRVRYTYRAVRRGDGSVAYITVPIYYPPRSEFVGVVERTVAETVYDKFLQLRAFDPQQTNEDGSPVELWHVLVQNRDSSNDLRKYLPMLTAAAMPVLGQQTENQQEVVLRERDRNVTLVRSGP